MGGHEQEDVSEVVAAFIAERKASVRNVMANVADVVFVSEGHVWWYCRGCKNPHGVPFSGPQGWQFNGDPLKPTLSPSVLCHAHGSQPQCHCFMREGRLEFLGDCTHDLAGQTVDMVPWDGWPT